MQPNKRGYALLPVLVILAALAAGWLIRSTTTAYSTQGASATTDQPPDKPPGTGI